MKDSEGMTGGLRGLVIVLYGCVIAGVFTALSLNVLAGLVALALCLAGPVSVREPLWTLTWKNAIIMLADAIPVLLLVRSVVLLPQQPMAQIEATDFLSGTVVFVAAILVGFIMKVWLILDVVRIYDGHPIRR
ncbi:hypothetical protein [Citreimonas salinaria]|uniref:Uncharacterized protein n=1 Tax=Citreimonas salinaria TaxID=321339 RepID=A0A1H3N785_9RHOB|nr:hypothetical protein [Citreimonas salinaria]SDY84678.1 hypothetical protein SAMN05444340_12115 [Citreimonas salinaria]